jgi:hypothetical protein
MRAHRALALLATAGAMLVAAATAALVGPVAATAAPAPAPPPAVPGGPQAYPPPPPSLTTSRASVKVGQNAHVFGNHFGYLETVVVSVTYSAGGHGATLTVRTDRFGRFGSNVRLRIAGTATVTATGKRTHFSASVTIRVRSKKPQAAPAPQRASTVGAVNPLVLANGPIGLGTNNQNANSNADLMANSDELTPGGTQYPLGAVGGVVAVIAGILLTLLAFRRRHTGSDR